MFHSGPRWEHWAVWKVLPLWVLPAEISFVDVSSGPTLQPSDVFEQPVPAGQRKIEFHITGHEAAAGVEENGRGQEDGEDKGMYVEWLDII